MVIFVIPVSAYIVILLWLWRRPLKRPLAAALMASTISLAANRWSGDIYRFLYPPSYSYIDDYEFVTGSDLLNPTLGGVVCYERVPWATDHPRRVVFAERRLEHLYDDEFLPLLESQGLKLDKNADPAPRPPKQN